MANEMRKSFHPTLELHLTLTLSIRILLVFFLAIALHEHFWLNNQSKSVYEIILWKKGR